MDVTGIVLGGAIAIASGTVMWYLNSRTSREVQERQQKHELEMQEQRLEAERQNRRDESARNVRYARLQPVFDLLAEVEGGYAHRAWKLMLEQAEVEGALDSAIAQQLPQDVREQVWTEVVNRVPPSPVELLARASAIIFRVDDEDIRRDLLLLVFSLFKSDLDIDALLRKIADVHARLERYAASVDSPA